MEKAELIAAVYRNQAAELEPKATAFLRESAVHEGARDMCALLAKNMAAVSKAAQDDVEADDELGPEQTTRALYHLTRLMRRIDVALKEAAKNQANLIMAKSAKAQFAADQAADLMRRAELELAKAARKDELIAEEEAKAAKEKKPARKRKPKVNGVNGTKRAPRKKATKKAVEA